MPELVALQSLLPQIDTPDVVAGKAMKIQMQQAAQQQAQAEAQARQQALADDQGARAAFAANPTDGTARLNALAGVSPKLYAAEAKQQADLASTGATTKAKEIETAGKKIDLAGQAYGYVRNNPTPENAMSAVQYLVDSGVYSPEHAAGVIEKIKANPGNIKALADQAFASALSAKDQLAKIDTRDTGGQVQQISTDPVTGKVTTLASLAKTQTPDSIASNARIAAEGAANRANAIKVQTMIGDRQSGDGKESNLAPEDLNYMTDQALRGDKSVFQNIGRGAQGAANLTALRANIRKVGTERGIGGADLAAINADYSGQTAGLRTSGNISARIENAAAEAAQLAPLAVAAGRDVARSGFLPFGRAQVMFNNQTNDPALNKFATANMGLATAYAGAMARGQKATVSDQEHARELLSTAKSQEAYEATVEQMQQEIKAAQRAPQTVRENLRNEVSGKGGHGAPAAAAPAAPKAGTVVDGYRFKGGDPAKQSSWEKQ